MGTGRRTFLKLAASMVCVRGASAQAPFLRDLPTFDGDLAYDSATRHAAATDWGREIQRPPTAVLKPASATDIARLVTYANKHHLKIAMRGQGHSTGSVAPGLAAALRGTDVAAVRCGEKTIRSHNVLTPGAGVFGVDP